MSDEPGEKVRKTRNMSPVRVETVDAQEPMSMEELERWVRRYAEQVVRLSREDEAAAQSEEEAGQAA